MIEIVREHLIPAAYAVLPPAMASGHATAMLVAIGWQESRFLHRRQINGPARGYWQFELGGAVTGILSHHRTREPLRAAMDALGYRFSPTPHWAHSTIEHNDVLAAVFARLLLWTLPQPLPDRTDPDGGWLQYVRGWRPGRPHPATWSQAWLEGWRAIV